MKQLMSLSLDSMSLGEYESEQDLQNELSALGCDGIEAIWGGEEIPAAFPKTLVGSYHLTFFPDWLDFWREDEAALIQKFGSLDTARAFYGGWGKEHLLRCYQDDLERARRLGAAYVVFHVSDVSINEGYSYRWLHESQDVIDAAAEVLNLLLPTQDEGFALLMENQWWPGLTFTEPGLTFTEPVLTKRLLDAVSYPRKGIMLDTGHLMNTNPELTTQAEGVAYIRRMLDAHGELCRYIRGVHLHQSLSGEYVRTHTGGVPKNLPTDYFARFSASYGHILQIDQHQPWTDGAVRALVERIAPDFLVHELTGRSRAARYQAVQTQIKTLYG